MSVRSVAFEVDAPGEAIGPDAVSPRRSDRMVFGLDATHFIELLLRAALFEMLTLGLYRFWLVNDVRRFLWSHTSLEGERLEYSGHGHELFLGFLGAFASLLGLLGLVYGPSELLGLTGARYAIPPSFFFLRQVATFEARRYRLSRTVWRGVRFWMDGSALSYAARAIAWDVAVVATIGLVWPWRAAALERYQLGASGYGALPGRFEGRASVLFRRVVWMWAVAMIPIGCLIYIAADTTIILGQPPDWSDGDAVIDAIFGPRAHIVPLIAVLLMPFLMVVLYPLYRAEEWRWWVEGIRFGDVEPRCGLGRAALVALYLKAAIVFLFAALCLAVGGLVGGLVALTIARISILDTKAMDGALAAFNENHPYAVLAVLAGAYVVTVLTLGAVNRFFFDYSLWRAILPTVSFRRLDAAEDVAAKGRPAGPLGEGLLGLLRIGGL